MKRLQIKELARAAVESGGLSDKDFQWVLGNFSRNELKMFANMLAWEVKNKTLVVNYAGEISEPDKKRITSLFAGKTPEFKRNEDLVAGVRLEYGDFVLDYSVSGIIKRILNSMRESL
ncbi:MAG: F0F1 ATP synthase subunit delta [Endomicrobium sp.]|jgi:F-type H+-transporting ATPase subunit delta|nr:F0F1 ATP synthase subunit delta [Endomicrobium sp.]